MSSNSSLRDSSSFEPLKSDRGRAPYAVFSKPSDSSEEHKSTHKEIEAAPLEPKAISADVELEKQKGQPRQFESVPI